jgi:hypothetical protein
MTSSGLKPPALPRGDAFQTDAKGGDLGIKGPSERSGGSPQGIGERSPGEDFAGIEREKSEKDSLGFRKSQAIVPSGFRRRAIGA